MKEEWKVYIKSIPGRGEEVIKTLTDLGAKNNTKYDFNEPEELFYIGHDGKVRVGFADTENGKIIMDNYRELHLPEQWKDGDVLSIKKSGAFVVFRRYAYMDGNGINHFETYFSIDENKLRLYMSSLDHMLFLIDKYVSETVEGRFANIVLLFENSTDC